MTGKDIYKIWAPEKSKWTNWARPVPFIEIDDSLKPDGFYDYTLPKISYVEKNTKNVAIIVDLPGIKGIAEGLSLIDYGFRPIPLYNGTHEQENSRALVDTRPIQVGLIWGASIIKNSKIDVNARTSVFNRYGKIKSH